MSKMIFVNLPVTDLDRSKAFYEAIGAQYEPKFSHENATMMALSDKIIVMLLRHEYYSTYTSKPIFDAHSASAVLLGFSADSANEVDATVDKAVAAGGAADPGPKQDLGGLMYGRSFEDPDGYHWEVIWMDSNVAEQGASAFQEA
jgi:predicted lactoylglutathione lyase